MIRDKELARQVPDTGESGVVDIVSFFVGSVFASLGVACLILALIIKMGLSQLWSMLNVQQVIVFMPLLENLKFPANAVRMNSFMLQIATMDLVPTELIDEMLYYFPD